MWRPELGNQLLSNHLMWLAINHNPIAITNFLSLSDHNHFKNKNKYVIDSIIISFIKKIVYYSCNRNTTAVAFVSILYFCIVLVKRGNLFLGVDIRQEEVDVRIKKLSQLSKWNRVWFDSTFQGLTGWLAFFWHLHFFEKNVGHKK